jgi:hypothetical protein
MEAETHSPWINRFLDSLGMEVVVARAVAKNHFKKSH